MKIMKTVVKNGSIVTPGELLAEGIKSNTRREYDGTYKKNESVYSCVVGIFNEKDLRVVKLSGEYVPRTGDYIIGRVVGMNFSNWFIDIGAPYDAGLRISEASHKYLDTDKYDMAHYFDFEDVVFAKIIEITGSKKISLTCKERGLGKLSGGILTKIDPSKYARLIGKNDSMVDMIEKLTKTRVEAGHNGFVWIKGEPSGIKKAKDAVKLVNDESHVHGLTKKVEKLLKKR